MTNALGLDLVPTYVLNIPGRGLITIIKNIRRSALYSFIRETVHKSETEAAKCPECRFSQRIRIVISMLAKVVKQHIQVSRERKKKANRFFELRKNP